MFDFQLEAVCNTARAGTLTTPHGAVQTPVFMPVGTQATVRALSPSDLDSAGAQIILSNTYHLHIRPGAETIARLGGLHDFMAWPRSILTDSGGFQVFSLVRLRRVTDDGVEFHSHVDGERHFLTPELVMEIQWSLGGDIAMAFDHVAPGGSSQTEVDEALQRTQRWLERCLERYRILSEDSPDRQHLWPIVQGGVYPELRRRAVDQITSLADFSGLAIGGLAVGEPKPAMYTTLEDVLAYLPRSVPRYLMGVGFPEDLLEAIDRGMDLFDCVAPTRNGRNGTAYTRDGRLNIRNARYREDPRPLEEDCDCHACGSFSRGYLRHLFLADELLVLRLLSLHNVRFLVRLAQQAREHIREGNFPSWKSDWIDRYNARSSP